MSSSGDHDIPLTTDEESRPTVYGVLTVRVKEARKLQSSSSRLLSMGMAHCYVSTSVRSLSCRTKMVSENFGSPMWKQTHDIPVAVARERRHPFNLLQMEVWRIPSNVHGSAPHELIGTVAFHLHDIIKAAPIKGTFDLYNGDLYAGEITLALLFTYGMFGYGYSHQLQLDDNDVSVETRLVHSLLPRIPPPEDRSEAQGVTLIPRMVPHPEFIPFMSKVKLAVRAMGKFFLGGGTTAPPADGDIKVDDNNIPVAPPLDPNLFADATAATGAPNGTSPRAANQPVTGVVGSRSPPTISATFTSGMNNQQQPNPTGSARVRSTPPSPAAAAAAAVAMNASASLARVKSMTQTPMLSIRVVDDNTVPVTNAIITSTTAPPQTSPVNSVGRAHAQPFIPPRSSPSSPLRGPMAISSTVVTSGDDGSPPTNPPQNFQALLAALHRPSQPSHYDHDPGTRGSGIIDGPHSAFFPSQSAHSSSTVPSTTSNSAPPSPSTTNGTMMAARQSSTMGAGGNNGNGNNVLPPPVSLFPRAPPPPPPSPPPAPAPPYSSLPLSSPMSQLGMPPNPPAWLQIDSSPSGSSPATSSTAAASSAREHQPLLSSHPPPLSSPPLSPPQASPNAAATFTGTSPLLSATALPSSSHGTRLSPAVGGHHGRRPSYGSTLTVGPPPGLLGSPHGNQSNNNNGTTFPTSSTSLGGNNNSSGGSGTTSGRVSPASSTSSALTTGLMVDTSSNHSSPRRGSFGLSPKHGETVTGVVGVPVGSNITGTGSETRRRHASLSASLPSNFLAAAAAGTHHRGTSADGGGSLSVAPTAHHRRPSRGSLTLAVPPSPHALAANQANTPPGAHATTAFGFGINSVQPSTPATTANQMAGNTTPTHPSSMTANGNDGSGNGASSNHQAAAGPAPSSAPQVFGRAISFAGHSLAGSHMSHTAAHQIGIDGANMNNATFIAPSLPPRSYTVLQSRLTRLNSMRDTLSKITDRSDRLAYVHRQLLSDHEREETVFQEERPVLTMQHLADTHRHKGYLRYCQPAISNRPTDRPGTRAGAPRPVRLVAQRRGREGRAQTHIPGDERTMAAIAAANGAPSSATGGALQRVNAATKRSNSIVDGLAALSRGGSAQTLEGSTAHGLRRGTTTTGMDQMRRRVPPSSSHDNLAGATTGGGADGGSTSDGNSPRNAINRRRPKTAGVGVLRSSMTTTTIPPSSTTATSTVTATTTPSTTIKKEEPSLIKDPPSLIVVPTTATSKNNSTDAWATTDKDKDKTDKHLAQQTAILQQPGGDMAALMAALRGTDLYASDEKRGGGKFDDHVITITSREHQLAGNSSGMIMSDRDALRSNRRRRQLSNDEKDMEMTTPSAANRIKGNAVAPAPSTVSAPPRPMLAQLPPPQSLRSLGISDTD